MIFMRKMFDLSLVGAWTFDALYEFMKDAASAHGEAPVVWQQRARDGVRAAALPERDRRATSAAGTVRLRVTETTDEGLWPGLEGPHLGLGTFVSKVEWVRPGSLIPRLVSRGSSEKEPSRLLTLSDLKEPLAEYDRARRAIAACGVEVRVSARNAVQNAGFALALGAPARALEFLDLPAASESLFLPSSPDRSVDSKVVKAMGRLRAEAEHALARGQRKPG